MSRRADLVLMDDLKSANESLVRENKTLKSRLKSLRGATATTIRMVKPGTAAAGTRNRSSPPKLLKPTKDKLADLSVALTAAQAEIKALRAAAAAAHDAEPKPKPTPEPTPEPTPGPAVCTGSQTEPVVAVPVAAAPPPAALSPSPELVGLRKRFKALEDELAGAVRVIETSEAKDASYDRELELLRADNDRLCMQTMELQTSLTAARSRKGGGTSGGRGGVGDASELSRLRKALAESTENEAALKQQVATMTKSWEQKYEKWMKQTEQTIAALVLESKGGRR